MLICVRKDEDGERFAGHFCLLRLSAIYFRDYHILYLSCNTHSPVNTHDHHGNLEIVLKQHKFPFELNKDCIVIDDTYCPCTPLLWRHRYYDGKAGSHFRPVQRCQWNHPTIGVRLSGVECRITRTLLYFRFLNFQLEIFARFTCICLTNSYLCIPSEDRIFGWTSYIFLNLLNQNNDAAYSFQFRSCFRSE